MIQIVLLSVESGLTNIRDIYILNQEILYLCINSKFICSSTLLICALKRKKKKILFNFFLNLDNNLRVQ